MGRGWNAVVFTSIGGDVRIKSLMSDHIHLTTSAEVYRAVISSELDELDEFEEIYRDKDITQQIDPSQSCIQNTFIKRQNWCQKVHSSPEQHPLIRVLHLKKNINHFQIYTWESISRKYFLLVISIIDRWKVPEKPIALSPTRNAKEIEPLQEAHQLCNATLCLRLDVNNKLSSLSFAFSLRELVHIMHSLFPYLGGSGWDAQLMRYFFTFTNAATLHSLR